MDAIDKKILSNYLGLIERLTPALKLSLIERLNESAKSTVDAQSRIKSAFGAWSSNESAEELINTIRNSRNTNREIEEI